MDLNQADDVLKRLSYDMEGDNTIIWKSGKN
jgi:hypothetical protein